jgi:hypothetical protein
MLALGFVLFGSGCGKRLVTVKGTVTLDGKPVHRATVVFEPLTAEGFPAAAQTNEEGVFYLGTHKSQDGAYPGEYRVTVTPPAPLPKVTAGMDNYGEALRQYWAGMAELRKNPPKLLPFPPDVQDPAKTTLRQRVPPDGAVLIDLESSGAQPPRIQSRGSKGMDPYQKPPGKR